jgi:hypothetical protein
MPISGKAIREALLRSDERLKNALPDEILTVLKRADPSLGETLSSSTSAQPNGHKPKVQQRKSKHTSA